MAQNGEIQRATEALEHLKDSLGGSPGFLSQYYLAKGEVNLIDSNYGQAISNLKRAQEISGIFPVAYMLGKAYLANQNYDKAIEVFQKQLLIYESYRVCRPTWSVKMNYYLGLSFEAMGRYDDAISQYERFLDIWKNADRGIEEIEDARIRLSRLNNRS